MSKKMNLVYHSSDLFAPVLATSMVSVFENNKSFDEINVYVFENPLSNDNKNKIIGMTQRYNRKVFFIPMPDVNKTQHLGLEDVRAGWFFNSYMKLYLDELLPEDVERVLYLDSDILVMKDLTSLWEMDMRGYCAAGVIDCLGEKYYDVLGLSKKAKYCNSGMILEDIKLWKEKKVGDKVRAYCEKNGGYVFFMEQTAFNAALDGEIYTLHPKYNTYSMLQCLTYDELLKLRKMKRFYSRNKIAEAVEDPSIIHLTNSFLFNNRAWYEGSNHPCSNLYQKYKNLTPWKNEPNFPDNRSFREKAKSCLIRLLPKSFVITIASKIYNGWRVNKINNTIKDAQKRASEKI